MQRFQNVQLLCTPQQPRAYSLWLQGENCILGIGGTTIDAANPYVNGNSEDKRQTPGDVEPGEDSM